MKCQLNNCNAYSMKDGNYCFRHNPDTDQARALASSKGGQNRTLQGSWGHKVKLNSPKDIRVFLSQVINGVWSGEIPVPVGSSMGFLTRCWLDAHEASEVSDRLDELEEKIDSK